MKKIISFILSIVIAVTGISVAVPSALAVENGSDIPVIYISGYGGNVYKYYDDGSRELVYPFQIPEGYIDEKVDEILPVFAEAFFTQQWDEFCDVLVDALVPIFEPVALDKNGESTNGTRNEWIWYQEHMWDRKNEDGKYDIFAYRYIYDWRLDPLAVVDGLHGYIEAVLAATGCEKVALVGRCLGSNVVAAYMAKYDGQYVRNAVHYASSFYGATQCSKAFTGELFLHADGAERFVYDLDLGLDEIYTDLITSLVTMLNKTYGLDVACWAVNNVVEDIYLDIFPEVMRAGFATFPSYWSMVSNEDFERAMATVFYGVDINEYSGLVEKIYNFRNNVRLPFEQDTKDFISRGIEVSNIVKYGIQTLPVTENGNELSDQTVTVRESSFGATTAEVEETFTNEYINNAIANGTDKYISPDKQIDASTCLLPDNTWYIKNLVHKNFPDNVNLLIYEIINNLGYNVFSDDQYPQYLVFDDETQSITAMTEDNLNTTERWNVTYFEALIKFFKALFELIRQKLVG